MADKKPVALAKPLRLGNITAKNRIWQAPLWTRTASVTGEVSDLFLKHYCARETAHAEHTNVLDMLTKESIRPATDILKNTIDELSGSKLTDEKLSLTTASIIAQCTFFHTNSAAIPLLFDIDLSKNNIVTIISDHITKFAINALQKTERNN